MVDPVDDHAASVLAAPLGPHPNEWHEMASVECNQNPSLSSCEPEDVRVAERRELGALVEGKNIMAVRSQLAGYPPPRDVHVEEDAQGLPVRLVVREVEERVELPQLRERAPVLA